jgi:hypothetical protein
MPRCCRLPPLLSIRREGHTPGWHSSMMTTPLLLVRHLEDPDRSDSSPIAFSVAEFRRGRWHPLIAAASDTDILRLMKNPALQAMRVAPTYTHWLQHDRFERESRGEVLCKRCNHPGNSTCIRCGQARYCSRACQVDDWKAGHKQECKPPISS